MILTKANGGPLTVKILFDRVNQPFDSNIFEDVKYAL